ncbi:MAG: hypothetical protein LBD24_05605 [Spirochaetaceae bacterium]|jgi:hypothetical protein|nr:hypothetical protein [Spirochaetaceae bacterium]
MRIGRLPALVPLFLSAAGAFCFDVSSFPEPVRKRDALLSVGFGIGMTYDPAAALMGGVLALDYALPVPLGLTVGFETGMAGAALDDSRSVGVIPVLIRIAWHPNWGIRNLDTSVTAKMGVGFGFWLGDRRNRDNPAGFAFGFTLGARYFLTPSVGVFAELGYDHFMLPFKTGARDVDFNAMRIFSIGVTFAIRGGGEPE